MPRRIGWNLLKKNGKKAFVWIAYPPAVSSDNGYQYKSAYKRFDKVTKYDF
jgi:hypothetical protein